MLKTSCTFRKTRTSTFSVGSPSRSGWNTWSLFWRSQWRWSTRVYSTITKSTWTTSSWPGQPSNKPSRCCTSQCSNLRCILEGVGGRGGDKKESPLQNFEKLVIKIQPEKGQLPCNRSLSRIFGKTQETPSSGCLSPMHLWQRKASCLPLNFALLFIISNSIMSPLTVKKARPVFE